MTGWGQGWACGRPVTVQENCNPWALKQEISYQKKQLCTFISVNTECWDYTSQKKKKKIHVLFTSQQPTKGN